MTRITIGVSLALVGGLAFLVAFREPASRGGSTPADRLPFVGGDEAGAGPAVSPGRATSTGPRREVPGWEPPRATPLSMPARSPPAASEALAALQERLLALEAERDQLAARVKALEAGNAALSERLLFFQHPEDTPYGAFLRSPEAAVITDPDDRRYLRLKLEDWPVILHPGEASWIVEVYQRRRELFGEAIDDDALMVERLGRQRLLSELPPDYAASLREYGSPSSYASFPPHRSRPAFPASGRR